MYSGQRLLSMGLSDFKNDFGDVGEIIFTAFKQVLDVAPEYTARSSLFANKIKTLINKYETGTGTTCHTSSFWRKLDIREWSKPEVMSWVNDVAEEYRMSVDAASHLGRLFGDIPGNRLNTMTLKEFQSMDSVHGDILCQSLESIKLQDTPGQPMISRPQGAMLTIKERLPDTDT